MESDGVHCVIEATQMNESAALKSIGLGNGSNKKGKGKPGRKARWMDGCTDDLVDIICNNEVYKKRIIFTNIKTSKNGSYYEKMVKELKERCIRSGETAFILDDFIANRRHFSFSIHGCHFSIGYSYIPHVCRIEL